MTQPPPNQPPDHPTSADPLSFGPRSFDPQFPPAQVTPPPIPPGPYAAAPQPFPGAVPAPRSTGKTIAIVLTIVLGTIALGVIVMAGACFGILSMLGA